MNSPLKGYKLRPEATHPVLVGEQGDSEAASWERGVYFGT